MVSSYFIFNFLLLFLNCLSLLFIFGVYDFKKSENDHDCVDDIERNVFFGQLTFHVFDIKRKLLFSQYVQYLFIIITLCIDKEILLASCLVLKRIIEAIDLLTYLHDDFLSQFSPLLIEFYIHCPNYILLMVRE